MNCLSPVRILAYSRDIGLRAEIAAANFQVSIDSSVERVRSAVLDGKCDLVAVDLACAPAGFLSELARLEMPFVVVADQARPLDAKDFAEAVQRAREGNRDEAPACGELVGTSPAAQAVTNLVRRVANVKAFVLITGETGTGKELIARAIHSSSDRAHQPFVAVSCGAIPESLIESELFGSEKGAFTGANARRTGYFEEAGEGTLFLDEIGEISLHTQIRLLRVLQQREFARLGSNTAIPLRARVVFATHRNLKQMVAEGTFREDLYYRLNVVAIQSQPLRERRDDIPLLARHLLTLHAESYERNVTRIDPAAMAILSEHSWPGNVRELENVIQRAIVMADEDTICVAHLPEELQQMEVTESPEAMQWSSFEARLAEYKTKLAFDAIKECNGNKTLAAQSLSISRTYLHRLIRGEDAEAA